MCLRAGSSGSGVVVLVDEGDCSVFGVSVTLFPDLCVTEIENEWKLQLCVYMLIEKHSELRSCSFGCSSGFVQY